MFHATFFLLLLALSKKSFNILYEKGTLTHLTSAWSLYVKSPISNPPFLVEMCKSWFNLVFKYTRCLSASICCSSSNHLPIIYILGAQSQQNRRYEKSGFCLTNSSQTDSTLSQDVYFPNNRGISLRGDELISDIHKPISALGSQR